MEQVIFSFAPIIKILKVFGLIPVNIFKKEKIEIYINYFLALISIIYWLFNFIARAGAVDFLTGNEAPITMIGLQARIIFPLAIIIVMICGSQIFKERFEKILMEISSFDKKVKKLK